MDGFSKNEAFATGIAVGVNLYEQKIITAHERICITFRMVVSNCKKCWKKYASKFNQIKRKRVSI